MSSWVHGNSGLCPLVRHGPWALRLGLPEQILAEGMMATITTLPSADFQRICRDMSNLGSEIEIKRDGKLLHLSCMGDFANQETSIECPDDSPKITGLYSLKYLNIFTKATSMCASVQIMQEEGNRFLIHKYNVANLGELKFYLATKVSEDQL